MKLNKKKSKQCFVLLGIGLLIGAACYTLFGKVNLQESKNDKEEVVIEELVQEITESGVVSFATNSLDYRLEFPFFEKEEDDEDSKYLRIEEVFVATGQRIEIGDPILKLTEKSIRNLRSKLTTAKSDAEIALEEAKTASELEMLAAKQVNDSSELEGNHAQAVYILALESLQKELEQAKAQIEAWNLEATQIEESLENSWEEFQDLEDEYEELLYEYEHTDQKASIANYVTIRDAYLLSKESYQTTKKERLERRDNIAELKDNIIKQETIISGLEQKLERKYVDVKQTYEESSLTSDLATKIYQYTVNSLQEEVENAEQVLAEIEQTWTAFEEFVGDGTIYAKEAGIITELSYEKENDITTTGPLCTYAYNEYHEISVDVSEEDISAISVGKEVTIVLNAYPGEQYNGIVTQILPKASVEYDTMISYPVTIEIKGDTKKVFGGMTGTVSFVTNEVKG